ncbi:MAG: MBOAT family protein, partial [Oscillospiraceae bacterium]|nr:MBOAT family protein [Oscillospiraceae bacterium]
KKLDKVPFIGHIYTILVAVCGWVLFDLPSLSAAGSYYASMFGFAQGGFVSAADLYYLKNFAVIFIAAIIAALPLGKKLYASLPQKVQNVLSPILIVCVLIISTAYLVDASYNPFLYFRF